MKDPLRTFARYTICFMLVVVPMAASISACASDKRDVVLATTTSTVDTGLLDVLVPLFEKRSGYRVKTIAVGTGQALAMGQRGEADVLLVHSPESEEKLVKAGVVVNYRPVMHNDFVIVGPEDDPAGAIGKSAREALAAIAARGSIFVSRGDDSGTHKKELALWKAAGIEPSGSWYQESGQGMGATLVMASEKMGYTLTDRGTYLTHKKNLRLRIISEGDETLLNLYHVMQVNPGRFSRVNGPGGKAFVEFMVDPEIQKMIGEFGREKYGQPLFAPDAAK